MSDFDHDTVIAAGPSKLASELGTETIVLDPDAGHYWSMSPVSGRIWELIQQPRPLGHILEVLLDEYDVAPERCEQEVREVLARMQQHGLIVVHQP